MRLTGLLLMALLLNLLECAAQKYNAESEVALSYLHNMRDTTLATGFYKIYTLYNDEDWSYKVSYKQTQKVVDVKRRFLLFQKSEPMRYVYSTAKAEVDTGKNFIRTFRKIDREFKVDPLPVAARQNIVRADTFRIKSSDSTFYYRVNVYVNFIDDSSLCVVGENRNKCPLIGMIINNQLVAVTNEYYKQYNGAFYRRYLVFEFHKENVSQVKKYVESIIQDKYN